MRIMYGIGGERRLTEFELEELPGYEGSKPVRVGNAASEQFQLDVYGELVAVLYLGATALGRFEERLWPRWRKVVDHVEAVWREPDDGIWESRGPRRHYTYSKVMAWVVFDRVVRLAEQFDLEAPLDRWKQVRDEIHQEVCEQGYDRERRTPSTTARRSSTQASSTYRSSASCPAPTSASPARSTRSHASSAATASYPATRPRRPTTDCPVTKDSSSPVRSGWSARSRSTAASRRPARSSSGSSGWQTISACWPRSTT
jgi:GH15 family glucan-1,4-alpha-glucosidase